MHHKHNDNADQQGDEGRVKGNTQILCHATDVSVNRSMRQWKCSSNSSDSCLLYTSDAADD